MSFYMLLPPNSRAWTAVSCARAHLLLVTPGYEVQYLRFLRDGGGWQTLTDRIPHVTRTRYRARERKLSSP